MQKSIKKKVINSEVPDIELKLKVCLLVISNASAPRIRTSIKSNSSREFDSRELFEFSVKPQAFLLRVSCPPSCSCHPGEQISCETSADFEARVSQWVTFFMIFHPRILDSIQSYRKTAHGDDTCWPSFGSLDLLQNSKPRSRSMTPVYTKCN